MLAQHRLVFLVRRRLNLTLGDVLQPPVAALFESYPLAGAEFAGLDDFGQPPLG